MTESIIVTAFLITKAIMMCAGIAGVVFLAYHGKQGWGWLIFILILLASTSFKHTSDKTTKDIQNENRNMQ